MSGRHLMKSFVLYLLLWNVHVELELCCCCCWNSTVAVTGNFYLSLLEVFTAFSADRILGTFPVNLHRSSY